MTRPPPKWALLALVVAAAVAVDQGTKFLAVDRLTVAFQRVGARTLPQKIAAFYGERDLEPLTRGPYVVWRPVWRMNYVENPGAAWSLFRGLPDGFRQGFFSLVTLAAVAFILRYYRKLGEGQRFLQVALAFVLAGAVGNFADRLARRYVIDFIEWHWWNRPDLRWPTFNVADSLIVVGVAMLLLHPGQKGKRPAATAGAERAGNKDAASGV